MSADPDTAPVLLSDGSAPHLLCRGADDNLYQTQHAEGTGWQPWRQLTTDRSVKGRISACFTTVGGTCAHVVHRANGGEVHYRRFSPTWALAEPPIRHVNATEGVLGSDGSREVLLLVRNDQDRIVAQRRTHPWTDPWQPVGERAGCLGLSNCVFFGGAFHVTYLFRSLRDDVSMSYSHLLAHTRFRARQYDDGYHRVVHEYRPQGLTHPRPTLAAYRNKLVAGFADEHIAVRAAYWDSADPQTPWIDLGAVASGRSTNPPALAAVYARSGLSCDDLEEANYGNDLLAAVTGGTMGGLWVVNFSRAFFGNRLEQIDLAVDWCTNYTGTRVMDRCTPEAGLPPVTELPVFSEVGFGTLALPDWLVHPVFRRTMDDAGEPGPYYTWLHPEPLGGAWLGPHLNIDYLPDYLLWLHEMGHRLTSSIGIWDVGRTHVNPNLMGDLLPDALVTRATTLFRTGTNDDGTCTFGTTEGRCRGFTGIVGDYEVKTIQHAWIHLIECYLSDAESLRQLA